MFCRGGSATDGCRTQRRERGEGEEERRERGEGEEERRERGGAAARAWR